MRPQRMSGPPPTREAAPRDALVGGLVGPFEVALAAGPGAPVAAREAVRAWMAGRIGETMLADALLLVSELVANSVRHADAPADAVVSVRAHVRADVLCLEVEDRGRTGTIARQAPDLQHGGGFGLNLVEAVSRRWGVNRDVGTRVWAEIAFRAAPEKRRDDREPTMQPDMTERADARADIASSAQVRADDARERALAARQAAEQATTGYARRSNHRVADLHDELAVSHEDFARRIRFGGGREGA